MTDQKLNNKRKNKRKGANPLKKQKLANEIKMQKPEIPEGKNPISIFYEFANSCNPKRIPSIKLINQNQSNQTNTESRFCSFDFTQCASFIFWIPPGTKMSAF